MTNRMMRVGVVAFALLGVACGDPEPSAPQQEVAGESPATPENTEATPPAEAPLVAPTAATVPIPEDFEAEMAEAVTPENYRAQFDSVLAELDAS